MSTPSPSRPGPSLARGSSRVSALADRAARAFAPQACLRGYAVFASGRVVVDALEDARAAVTVRGKRARALEVRAGDRTLEVRCSCAPSSLPTSLCRHAWAALLELDRREAFPGLRASRGPLRVATQGEGAAAPAPRPRERRRQRGGAKGQAEVAAPGPVVGARAPEPERDPRDGRRPARDPRASLDAPCSRPPSAPATSAPTAAATSPRPSSPRSTS